VTYNFDPEQWLELQIKGVEARFTSGELDEAGKRAALREIDRRYEQMVSRLDGTYQIPARTLNDTGNGD
jgi:hypothetical protein